MLTRVISAFIGIPVVVVLVFWPGGVPFAILVGAACLIGLLEFYGAARAGGARPHVLFGAVASILFIYEAQWVEFGSRYFIPTLIAVVLLAFTVELVRVSRAPFVNVGVTILGLCYVVWLLVHFIWLRQMGMDKVGPWNLEASAWLVMFVLATTWATDTGAYFTGRLYGKKKLAPNISPGKTVEGSVGGLVSAVIVGAAVGALINLPQPHGLILGGLMGIVGQVGDLVASAMKREVGVKDFGAIMPGHGGILDRIDSLLFTGPVFFWYLTIFLLPWIYL
ncbi:MAG: phosphatidate cytidylyltransferase [Armatimonadetes bacterium]|nr:phosphatidate cytidylyltransferase [Armatimonadota bacterium]